MAPDPEEPTPEEPTPGGVTPPPPHNPPPPYDPAAPPPRTGFSTGAGIGIGVGIGCGAHVIALALMFATLMLGGAMGATVFGIVWPFVLVAIVAIVMLFFAKTRGIAIGMLIVAAAVWIIVLGPCLGMANL